MKPILFFVCIICLVACSDFIGESELELSRKSNSKAILAFTFPEARGTVVQIDTIERYVAVKFPALTNTSRLTPLIIVSPKARFSPDSGVAQDFTNGMRYTVTAQNGTSHEYIVRTTVAPSSQRDILKFRFEELNPAVEGALDSVRATIGTGYTYRVRAKVPNTIDRSKLSPTITVSPKAKVSPESNSVQDFTKTVVYTVTAEDGKTKVYNVTVIVPITFNAISPTTYTIGQTMTLTGTGFVNGNSYTIDLVNTVTGRIITLVAPTVDSQINGTRLLIALSRALVPAGTYQVFVNTNDTENPRKSLSPNIIVR
jgi:hypothetical protein